MTKREVLARRVGPQADAAGVSYFSQARRAWNGWQICAFMTQTTCAEDKDIRTKSLTEIEDPMDHDEPSPEGSSRTGNAAGTMYFKLPIRL